MKTTKKSSAVMIYVLILFVCVASTTVALTSRLNVYALDDSGAISLIPESATVTDSQTTADISADTTSEATTAPETEEVTSADTEASPETTKKPVKNPQSNVKPGFEVSDDATVWSTDTKVDIFRVSYENGEQIITVNSSDGDKLLAPGTENSYVFKLKNTGNIAVDYTVEVDAYFSPDGTEIPISTRLCRYDGKWIVGGAEDYVDVPVLDTAEDADVLSAGKYTYYTLDWMWPYESGNDEFDTMLGNLAAEGEDLTLTIVIKTTAKATWDDVDSGITPPQTGDVSFIDMWIIVATLCAVLMVVLIIVRVMDKKEKDTEARDN